MPKDPSRAPAIRENACLHPAARAWRRAGGSSDPFEIRVLRERVNWQIYWLAGAGPSGVPIIAKRGKREAIEREQRIYTEVLPELPVPSLAYHGFVDDGGRHCWSFLEFASGDRYSPTRDDHRRLAGEWLGLLHAGAAEMPRVGELESCRPDQFFDSLLFARRGVASLLESAWAPADAGALADTARAIEALEKRWDDVREVCDAHPATLVHGDFAPKNLRVRGRAPDAVLEVFDWAESGCGPPAVDLTHAADPKFAANPSLDAYRRGFSAQGPTPPIELLKTFVAVGKVIRSLSAIEWELRRSKPGYVRGDKLHAYVDWMRDGMREVGWDRRRPATVSKRPRAVPGDTRSELSECLERELAAPLLGGARVDRIRRKPMRFASSYRAEVIVVELSSGQKLKAFLKDFGETAFRKDAAWHRRERELHVYRDLLGDMGLGTPQFYGSLWDKRSERFWLLLEYVDGAEVRYCQLDAWVSAARWIGRLHSTTRWLDRLEGSPLLVRHDADYFHQRAELALRDAAAFGSDLRERVRRVVASYGPVVEEMASQPLALVHGGYRPANVLLAEVAGTERVSPVDWELAAVGSPLYDLATFVDGFEPPELDLLLGAYVDEALAHAGSVPGHGELRHLVQCFQLARVINNLARANRTGYGEARVAKLVTRAEDLRAELRRGHKATSEEAPAER